MSTEEDVARSFVHAIEHAHIPLDDGDFSPDSLVLSDDVEGRKSQRNSLLGMIHALDSAVSQIDVDRSSARLIA